MRIIFQISAFYGFEDQGKIIEKLQKFIDEIMWLY